jgi:putative transposase
VLNRAVGRATLFDKPGDYLAFEQVLRQAQDWLAVPLLGYGVMPNHWHLMLWPQGDGDLSAHLRWQTVTHTQRWHAHRHTAVRGPLYQGRCKSFPVQEDEHLLAVLRYVERNALRAGLVGRAERWRWSSLHHRLEGGGPARAAGPVPLPDGCAAYVNEPQTEAERAALRRCLVRGAPYGDTAWQARTAEVLGLQASLRRIGRPRNPARA